MLHEIKNAVNAKWLKNRYGEDFFMTEDFMGIGRINSERQGSCLMVLTGGGKLQGRVASKIYSLLFATVKPMTHKKTSYLMGIDIKNVDKNKISLFATVYVKYFEKVVWSDAGKTNTYLVSLGRIVFKLIDVISNIVNSFCYMPPESLKESLKKRLDPFYVTDDRLEISPHYEETKAKVETGYSFCTVCSETNCSLNKAMCIQFATVAEMIESLNQFDGERQIKLTMLDFFRRDEINHFLDKFTTQGYPVDWTANLEWTDKKYGWPRKLTADFELSNAIIRYDIDGKSIYREDAWDGLYQKSMFHILSEDEIRIPVNLEELLDSNIGAVDDTIVRFNSNESLKELVIFY